MYSIKFSKLLIISLLAIISSSCTDEDYNQIQSDLLGKPNYNTGVFTPTISVTNIAEKSVQTNGLGGYLLGKYTQNPFGEKKATILAQVILPSVSPIFGENTQATENANSKSENEKAEEVYLYIPFFNSKNAVSSYTEGTSYELDSIYGNKSASFDLQISELNYQLKDIDTDLKSQVYYSDFNASTFVGTSVGSKTGYVIDNQAIKRLNIDNPETTDDESKTTLDILAPGIRIALDKDFFQQKILDKEDSDELSNLTLFKNYFKGIVISADNFSADLMMLLNLANAKIEMLYSYETEKDGATIVKKNRYEMSLSGISVNLFSNNGESITADTDPSNTSRIYLSGMQGRMATISLFTDAELTQIKQNNWLITDATLKLSVDNSVAYSKEPERIYIFNTKTGGVLADYYYDPTQGTSSTSSNSDTHLIHLGKLQKENGKGAYYELKITNHILNIIKNNAENVPLGIVVGSNIQKVTAFSYLNSANEKKIMPLTAITTPLSTIIYGNSPSVDENKRIQLKISYTKLK